MEIYFIFQKIALENNVATKIISGKPPQKKKRNMKALTHVK